MKGLKKSLAPIKSRRSSPSLSSSSSTSSSSTQFSVQQQHYREAMRAAMPLPRPLNIHPRSPEIIIRAIADHRAQRIIELSYKTGEFLQVLGEVWAQDGTGWFEATDPVSGARGFVLMDHFQVFSSGGYHSSRPSQPANTGLAFPTRAISKGPLQSPKPPGPFRWPPPSPPSAPSTQSFPSKEKPRSRQPLYGIVRYDFMAERPDELQARKGEAIILIAHSHQEWFVAKPIGRLGGPGLIPVAFVEVKDLTTGKRLSDDAVKQLIQNRIVPGVNEWKRAAAAYRGNSIPLGRFENPSTTVTQAHDGHKRMEQETRSQHKFKQLAESTPESPSPPESAFLASGGHSPAPTSPQLSEIPVPSTTVTDNLGALMTKCAPPLSTPIQIPSSRSMTIQEPVDCNQEETRFATVEDLRERYGIFVHASVESFHMEEGNYWFHLRSHFNCPSATNSSGEKTTVLVLYRLYEDFFDFHAGLLDAFPAEGGRESLNQPNILPKLPEPKEHVDELVCADRMTGLSNYLEELSRLPSYIREGEIFYEFLGPREGDVELHEELETSASSPNEAHSTSLGQKSPPIPEDQQVDRRRKISDLISTDLHSNPQTSGPAAPPRQRALSRKSMTSRLSNNLRLSRSSNTLSSGVQDTLKPFASPPLPASPRQSSVSVARGQHRSNFSSSTTASAADSSPLAVAVEHFANANTAALVPKSFHRIKIYQENTTDVIAIRAPSSLSRSELAQKVFERVQSVTMTGLNSDLDKNKSFIGKLSIKNLDQNRWIQLETDEQFQQWLIDCQNRLMVLYSQPD